MQDMSLTHTHNMNSRNAESMSDTAHPPLQSRAARTEETPQMPVSGKVPLPVKRSGQERRTASEKELEKQQEYLRKASLYTAQLAGRLGRTPTFHVHNFGCQMNARDAEKLSGILIASGYREIQEESADFVIYNTCTVRDNADQHFFGRLGRAAHHKKSNPYMKIAVCGCMTQEKTAVEKIRKSYPYVDLIFGTHNLFCFPQYLCEIYEAPNGAYDPSGKGHKLTELWDATDEIVEDLPVERKYSYKSGINIMFGCDNYCTYCIVPYVRGHERSREPGDIIRECERLVKDGVVEVMLLGQNVNSYGKDLEQPCTFAELLSQVAEIPGMKRVRFMTPHPKDMGRDVLEVIRSHPNIARHIHFPLQSGSNEILRRMNRRYTREQFMEKAEQIRELVPDAAITTDIIAGFPGETDKDVEDTVDVVNRVGFDNAYTFIYSPRRGTPAAAMEQVPREKVQEGFDRILAAVQENARRRAAAMQGRTMVALAEEINSQDASLITCRLSNNLIVHVKGDVSMIGHFYDVTLDECRNFYYFGTVLGENPKGYE